MKKIDKVKNVLDWMCYTITGSELIILMIAPWTDFWTCIRLVLTLVCIQFLLKLLLEILDKLEK